MVQKFKEKSEGDILSWILIGINDFSGIKKILD